MRDPETVPCGMCGTPTTMTGTQRCDRCWELERRVQSNPELARQVLRRLDPILICREHGDFIQLRIEEEREGTLFSSSRLVTPVQCWSADILTRYYSEMLAIVRSPAEVTGV